MVVEQARRQVSDLDTVRGDLRFAFDIGEPHASATSRIRILTWNIHAGIGADGCDNLDRSLAWGKASDHLALIADILP
jgi:endonuclease/exonuclease/phosphatase family metal-dependent hydrolase